MADEKPIVERCNDLVDRYKNFWSAYHDAADEEDAFLDGDCYEDNEDYQNRDRRLVQIRGKETEDTIRHWAAELAQRPMNLIARPIDRQGDPATGEFMTALVDHELRRVDKDFQGEFVKALLAAQEHRCGIIWMDWHPEAGPWGEIFFGEEDFRGYMWDPSYAPHHPMNAWVVRDKRLYVDEAREMYNAPWLEPDRTQQKRIGRPDRPLLRSATNFNPVYDDDKTTIRQVWWKNDKSKKYRDNKDGKDRMLEKKDRYLSCVSNCGFRSPRQSDFSEELPEFMEQACPTCGGNLERIDSLGEQETLYAFSRGHRLTIISPFHAGSEDQGLLFDGKWPVSRCRSYPGFFFFFQMRSGGRPMGGSQVSWAWDQQVASNQLRTMAVQQVFESGPIYILPKRGLYDRNDRRWERRDDQDRTAFRDDSDTYMRERPVERIEGSGLDQGWSVAFGAVQQALTQHSGKTDFGFGGNPEKSLDVAASTLAQVTKQENLPISEFNKRNRRAVAQGCGPLSDMVTATYTPARLARLNIEGVDMVLEVWGQDLPGFDFEIEDTPEFTGQEKARVEALQMLDNVFSKYVSQGAPAEIALEMVALYAEEMHFPPSTVTKFQKVMGKLVEAQQQAQQQQGQMMEDEAAQDLEAGLDVPGMPSLAVGSPEEGMEQGQNGAGMAPAL